jgi:AbrB family looped-hinge helix DNA binding protein
MADYATTRLSSKGQVMIPEQVRQALGLNEGDRFVVIAENDTVILKAIAPPKLEKLGELLNRSRAQAKKARLKRSDVKAAIVAVRRRAK